MFRFVPRAMLGAVVAVTAAACAAGGAEPANGPAGGDTGGRFRILVPTFEAQGVQPRQAESVANDLRAIIYNQATHHTAVPVREIQGAQRQHGVAELDAITARQLAQVMNAQLVTWGSVQPGGEGLVANMTVTSVATGDQFEIEGATGANPRQLAQAIFASLNERLQGILMAGNCQDFLSTQEFDRALDNCRRALQVLPNNTAALYGAATALFHMEQFEESLQHYQQLLEVDPAHQDGLLGAGLAASRLERGQEALGFYNRYLELNPGDVQVRMAVSGQIVEAGDVVSAFRILQPAIQDNADNVDFQQYLAQVATAAGQRAAEQGGGEAAAREYYDTALRAYERVFAARGDELEAPVMRQAIAVNLELGRTDEALRLAQQATQRFPQDAGVWAQYASVLNRAGRAGEEVRALTRLIEIDAQFENAYIRRALAYQRAGNRQQALADFERAAQVGDRALVGQAIFGMAADELRRERWAEAEGLLATAAQYAAPNIRGEISFFRGLAAFRQGERIARANTQGRPDPARQALQFFNQAIPHLQASNNPQAAQVLSATRQYIENQEAIIQAARGR
jgi:tetratricopeptide (TPR) repeat protein